MGMRAISLGNSMNEQQANAVATVLNGSTWQSGGDTWLVVLHRTDARTVVISGDSVCEYENEPAFENGDAAKTLLLR
jgi:hypothetical protein